MIYLDNAATTKPCSEAAEAAVKCASRCFGNPSSLHHMGVEAEKAITSAKKTLLNRLGKEGEIFLLRELPKAITWRYSELPKP